MKNHSILIFGSSVRRDFDKYSDKDLLIASDSFERLNELRSYYSRENWSISTYTYNKLNYLSRNGSLFIKHLEKEGKYLKDDDGKLEEIISSFRKKGSYESDLLESLNYFKILDYYPDTISGFAWFCDCFYVGLRNYLILKYADKGIFEFSYLELLNLLENDGLVSIDQHSVLKEVRVIKRNYRENFNNELPDNNFLESLVAIGKQLGLIKSSKKLTSIKYQKLIKAEILNSGFGAYQKLRLVEGIYNSQLEDIPELKRIISNPQFYSAKLNDDNYVEKLLSQITYSKKVFSKESYLSLVSY